jgi:hypothetical protein
VARTGTQVAVKVAQCLGAAEGAGRKPAASPFSDIGETQAVHELPQNFCRLVMAALHDAAEPVAAQGVRDIISVGNVAARAPPPWM